MSKRRHASQPMVPGLLYRVCALLFATNYKDVGIAQVACRACGLCRAFLAGGTPP